MNIESTDQKRPTPAGCAKRTLKKPYVKPMVRHERVFETMALTCGKVQTTQSGCQLNRKTS